MKHSNRNSLFLLVLIFLILIVSSLYYFLHSRKLNEITMKNEQIQNQINQLKSSFVTKDSSDRIKDTLDDLRFRVKMNNKVLLKEEDSKLTYNYLTKISKKFTPKLAFNFLNETKEKKGKQEAAIYKISGSATAWDLFRFLYHIEFQAPLYTIEELNFSENTERKSDNKFKNYINYSFKLKGHSKVSGISWDEIVLRKEDKKIYSHNVFRKKLYAPRIIANEEEYLHVEDATLLSITTDNVLVHDGEKTHTLLQGDKVAYGYLKEIDWKNQSVIFSINKIGISQKKVLKFNGKIEEDMK